MPKMICETMSPSEITQTLNGWGFYCTEQNLKEPTMKFVEGTYACCLKQVTFLAPEVLVGPARNALESTGVDDPEMYIEPLLQNMMIYHFARLAQAARVEGGFNMTDLTMPRARRVQDILSSVINFIKFVDVNCKLFVSEVQSRAKVVHVERDEAALRLEETLAEIKRLKDKNALDEPRCETLRKENKVIREEMMETKDHQTQIKSNIERLRCDKNDIVNRHNALHQELCGVEDQVARTRARIVQSPDRLKRTIATLTHTTAEDKKNVSSSESKARDLQAKVTALLSIEREVKSCIDQLRIVAKEVEDLERSQNEVADLQKGFEASVVRREDLTFRQERTQKELSNAQDKLERARKHAEDKRLVGQKTIDRLKQEYDEMSTERRDNDKEMEKLKKEASEIEAMINDHLVKSEAELNELLTEYWKLRHETEVYMETLSNKLNIKVLAG